MAFHIRLLSTPFMNAASNKQTMPWFLLCVVIVVAATAGVIVWQLNQHKPSPERITAPAVPVQAPSVDEDLDETAPAGTIDTAREPVVAQETTQVAEVSEEEPQIAPTAPAGDINLDTSDAAVDAHLAKSPAAQLGQWLVPEHKIRKLVRAVNALEEGKLVSQYRPTLPPETPFKAEPHGEQWRLSEANFTRYEPYITALEQAGPEQLMALYRHYSPLLEQAYQELGVEKGSFDEVTRGALKQIINTPTVEGPVALSTKSVVFHYQDKELEQLPELHKLLIRMGPENRKRVQDLAQKLLQQMEQ